MPRPRLTDEEISAMRERIMDAALELLHEKGPNGLTIRSIADRVGVSHMVFYTYFDSRDDLMAAMRDRKRLEIQARHSGWLNRAQTGNVLPVIRDLLEDYVRFARHNPRVFHFMLRALLSRGECKPHPSQEGIREESSFLAQFIQIGVDRGDLAVDDTFNAAVIILGMINGALATALAIDSFDDSRLEQFEADLVEAALAYLTGNKD